MSEVRGRGPSRRPSGDTAVAAVQKQACCVSDMSPETRISAAVTLILLVSHNSNSASSPSIATTLLLTFWASRESASEPPTTTPATTCCSHRKISCRIVCDQRYVPVQLLQRSSFSRFPSKHAEHSQLLAFRPISILRHNAMLISFWASSREPSNGSRSGRRRSPLV